MLIKAVNAPTQQTISYSDETIVGLWRTSHNLNLKVLMKQKMNSIKIR